MELRLELISYLFSKFSDHYIAMAALNLVTRDEAINMMAKRSNWAGKNAGVMVVFCILFIVGVGLVTLFIYRKVMARKARKLEAGGQA